MERFEDFCINKMDLKSKYKLSKVEAVSSPCVRNPTVCNGTNSRYDLIC